MHGLVASRCLLIRIPYLPQGCKYERRLTIDLVAVLSRLVQPTCSNRLVHSKALVLYEPYRPEQDKGSGTHWSRISFRYLE